MEGQITLTEWMQWREDIRKKLQETAGNFVYIGYRLKQIRDSGMYDGCTDIFEFAQKEYGLGKSVVSRFIAINEKFSEGGNSLEIRAEYRSLGSSKLSEMLTLSDEDCQLITTETTVKEIREIKHFNKQVPIAETDEMAEEKQYTPLQKCIIDFFKDKKEVLNELMGLLDDGWQIEQAAKVINPGDYITHKKGIVFLFMYDFRNGVAYKLMGQAEPVKISWDTFLNEVAKVFEFYSEDRNLNDYWSEFYSEKKLEETVSQMPENRENTPVATSQQNSEKEEELPPQEAVEITEKEEKSFVDVNKIADQNHDAEDGKMAEENHISQAEKMAAEDHGVDVNEMVPEEHIPDTGKMISEERVVDVGKTLEKASEEEVPVAAEPVKLTEEDVEELPAEKPSIWEDIVHRDFQELKGDMENKNWQLAFITARKLMSHLETLIKEEQK